VRALLLVACLVPALGRAAPPGDLAADEIIRRSQRAGSFAQGGAEARVRMVLTAPGRPARERRLHSFSRDEGGLARSLVRFEAPPDVAGTAYLRVEQRGRDDDHYLYRPELRRARRIAGAQRGDSFMGTDFSYHDLESRALDRARHRRLPDEAIGGAPCYVVESTSTSPGDPYGKVVSWVRKDGFVPLRVKFFGRDGAHTKTLFAKKVQKVAGRLVIMQARMTSVAAASSTDLLVDAIEFKDLPAAMFDPQSLDRG
jgi:hypothetical protein